MSDTANPLKYVVFCDLDGVLVDFDRGVKELTGKLPTEQKTRHMWPRLAQTPDFYASLPWMPDGPELWRFIQPYGPIILTGLPLGKWAKPQKLEWCRRELGSHVRVLAGWSKDKARDARAYLEKEGLDGSRTPILIDDREKLQEAWENHGGIFIHHRDAPTTIAALKQLGFTGPEGEPTIP